MGCFCVPFLSLAFRGCDEVVLLQVLSLMLEQTGMHLAAFPDAAFTLKNWTAHGHHCLLDKTPDRMLDIQVSEY